MPAQHWFTLVFSFIADALFTFNSSTEYLGTVTQSCFYKYVLLSFFCCSDIFRKMCTITSVELCHCSFNHLRLFSKMGCHSPFVDFSFVSLNCRINSPF